MNVVFRVDAALHIGSGHVMRCLTLADELTCQGVNCIFICREFDGNLFTLIKDKGYSLFPLPEIKTILSPKAGQIVPHEHWLGTDYESDAKQTIDIFKHMKIKIDWLIVDHYAIDIHWEQLLRPYVNKIMIIDDLADRKHDCDLLLDQNYYQQLEKRYQYLLPEYTQTLLGPSYSLLRKDFTLYNNELKNYRERFNQGNIIMFFGGIDSNNETDKALEGIKNSLREQDNVQIILGINNSNIEGLKVKYKKFKKFSFHIQINDMSARMANAYLYIGAVGTTTWERCVMFLPGIVVSVADNQIEMAKALNQINSHIYLGESSQTYPSHYKEAYQTITNNYENLFQMSKVSGGLACAEGVKNVVTIMIK